MILSTLVSFQDQGKDNFAIVFAAMCVNMETSQFFKRDFETKWNNGESYPCPEPGKFTTV